MRESFIQAIDNLRANKLRSFLTMFGIMWGIVSIVVLSALGEGFRRGNDAVLRDLIIKREEAVTEPSFMMKNKDDRDDNRGSDQGPRRDRDRDSGNDEEE